MRRAGSYDVWRKKRSSDVDAIDPRACARVGRKESKAEDMDAISECHSQIYPIEQRVTMGRRPDPFVLGQRPGPGGGCWAQDLRFAWAPRWWHNQ